MSTAREFEGLQTESRNQRSAGIDNCSTLELCEIINHEDGKIADVVQGCIPTIAHAVDAIAPRVREGGRVIYVGAGTSGRLGVLDASEIPPTFSARPSQFVGLIAGGDIALRSAKEGAEDSWQGAVDDLSLLDLDGQQDSLIGIASSGRTPYVLSALRLAKSKGCVTVGIACTAPSAMKKGGDVDFMIEAVTGPEVVTGSTRMKAGTATKLILNTMSTATMIKSGKTFGNIMVDVKPTNTKLEARARRILREICGNRCPDSDHDLDRELRACGRDVKLTAVKISLGVSPEVAKEQLQNADGVLANVLKKAPQLSSQLMNRTNKYVLCVDGGGSKCTAVLMSDDGQVGVGQSGPSNPNDIGTLGAVHAIQGAVQSAVQSVMLGCGTKGQQNIRNLCLVETWIGLAGGDRKAIERPVNSGMIKLLGCQRDMKLNVTNDVELVATAASYEFESKDVIILIAGTGSIAMRYRRDGDTLRRIARAGGWGALLGDGGSGFDIGRKAIRIALQRLEEGPLLATADKEVPDPLPNIICQYFRPTALEASDENLLNTVILSASGGAQSGSEAKQRIASCAKTVVAAAASEASIMAKSIISDAVDSLVNLVRVNLEQAPDVHSKPALFLVGGLFNSPLIESELMERLEMSDLLFSNIRRIDNPALIGARFLARKL